MPTSMKVEGMDHLLAKLDRIKMDTPRILRAEAKAGMVEFVQNPAKQKCAHDTGTLRREIHTEDLVDGVRTGTSLKYGIYVEFGTGLYAENGKGRKTPWVFRYAGRKGKPGFRYTKGMRAQPFLRPAWDEGKPKVLSRIKNGIGGVVRS